MGSKPEWYRLPRPKRFLPFCPRRADQKSPPSGPFGGCDGGRQDSCVTALTDSAAMPSTPQPETPVPAMPAMRLGDPTHVGALSVFPIWTDAPIVPRDYVTNVPEDSVEELPSGPSVSQVHIRNPLPEPILLLEGLVLEGGWQHRVVLNDVMVAPGSRAVVDVACVEQGRWGGSIRQTVGTRRAPLGVRSTIHGLGIRERVGLAPQERGLTGQRAVWAAVDRYETLLGGSATSSLAEVTSQLDQEAGTATADIPAYPGQRGVLVGLSGQPVLLELFDHPSVLAESLPAILTSLWPDAMGEPAIATPGHLARSFRDQVRGAAIAVNLTDGLGQQQVSIEHLPGITGRAINYRGRLLHASVLNAEHPSVRA